MVERDATFAVLTDVALFDSSVPAVVELLDLFGDSLETIRAGDMLQEGAPGYVLASPAIDNTFGQTAAFVLRQGIDPSMSSFAQELLVATDAAVQSGRFTPDSMSPFLDVDDEYLALALDVYYGIWGHDPRGDGTAGSNGEYMFNTRDGMAVGDPEMVALIEGFFPVLHNFPAFLDNTFAETFEMEFDAALPYTHRSQYLVRVGLREGGLAARVNGNVHDNVFLGNSANNVFEGRGGNDRSDLGNGVDEFHFEGALSEYTITEPTPQIFRVEDRLLNRDGIDDIRGATQFVFSDATMNL